MPRPPKMPDYFTTDESSRASYKHIHGRIPPYRSLSSERRKSPLLARSR